MKLRGRTIEGTRIAGPCVRDAFESLLLDYPRQHPALTRRQVIRPRLFTLRRQRGFAEAFHTKPPRRVGARTIRITLAGENECIFSGGRKRCGRQLGYINVFATG